MSSPPKNSFDPSTMEIGNYTEVFPRDSPLANIVDENVRPVLPERTPSPGDEIPSSAIFVKNIETTISEEDLREAFLQFMTIPDRDKLLIAAHFDRGFAFVDLGSKEAVARAVLVSRSSPGILLGGQRVVVEPSKKPVRPSGVRAIQEERTRSAKKGKRLDKHDFGKVLKSIDDVLAKGLGGLIMGGSYSNSNTDNQTPCY